MPETNWDAILANSTDVSIVNSSKLQGLQQRHVHPHLEIFNSCFNSQFNSFFKGLKIFKNPSEVIDANPSE